MKSCLGVCVCVCGGGGGGGGEGGKKLTGGRTNLLHQIQQEQS